MNEAAQVLRQTNHERKVAGYGAHHKKGGSAVSKLGNKPMSWQEINSKHGECKEYDLVRDQIDFWRQKTEAAKIIDLSEAQRKHDIIDDAEFIEYDEFSNFTTDEKVLYLNSLIDKYGVSLAAIERELFKLPITNLRHKLDSAGVLKQIKRGKSGFNAARANKDFCDALKNWRGESTLEEKPEPVVEPVKEESAPVAASEAVITGDEKPAEETPVTKSTELPESNISDFYIPVEDGVNELIPEELETPKLEETNRHTMVFTSNYRSIGLDSDELEGMKIMCKNKLVEVCITIRTI